MQLRLIRFHLLILLLVSLIDVEALEKLSRVATLTPGPTAMPFQQVSLSSWANDEKVFESPKIYELVAQVDPESRGPERRRDIRRRHGEKIISQAITFSPSHATTLLAEKLAQDALHSKEMQDTIRELTSLNDNHKKHQEISKEAEKVFQPTAKSHGAEHAAKESGKSKNHSKHKGQDNRKHNRHRKRGRKHRHPKRRLKRRHSKKESSKTARERKSRKSISRGRRRGLKGKFNSENSVTCRRKRSGHIAKTKNQANFKASLDNFAPFVNGDKNTIDEQPNLESTQRTYKRIIPILRQGKRRRDIVNRKRSHILAQLMRTTTRDPTKKKPGDQGVEYSEYYNDDDNILSPDIRPEFKPDEVAKTLLGGQIRSVRDTADENFLDQHYDDSLDERLLEEDGERLKRNDQKFVRVMEQPSNSMEYVDNTYGPALQANGVVDSEKIPQYLTNYNYVPDQSAEYQALSHPPAEVVGLRRPTPKPLSSDVYAIVDRNPPVIQVPPMANSLDTNPMINNVKSVAPRPPGLNGNVVLTQLPQPRLAEGNLPYYSVREIPLEHSLSSLTSPAAFSISTSLEKAVKDLSDIDATAPEGKKLSRLYVATSVVTSSSLSGLNPTLSYHSSGGNSGILESVASGKGMSAAPASLAKFRVTFSPADISSAVLDSPEIFSKLRDIRPEVSAPEAKYSSDNEVAENIRGPDPIGLIGSRETAAEGTAAKKEKEKDSKSKETDVQVATTVSEIKDVEKAGHSKATKDTDSNVLPMTSCRAAIVLGSSTPVPANKTLITNETKAVASEILNEIIDELEELKLENPKNEQKEGLPCKLTGSWVTARAGVRIDMKVSNHSVNVSLDYLTPPITTEGILNVTWNVTGFAPFKRGGPFTLLATNNHTKTLAVFVGACKVCQGVDTIEGSWTVSREPRDCRDFQMSTNIFNEIFRRTRLYAAIKDKQLKQETQALNTTVTTSSGNSSTSESTSTIREVSDGVGKSYNQSSEFNGRD